MSTESDGVGGGTQGRVASAVNGSATAENEREDGMQIQSGEGSDGQVGGQVKGEGNGPVTENSTTEQTVERQDGVDSQGEEAEQGQATGLGGNGGANGVTPAASSGNQGAWATAIVGLGQPSPSNVTAVQSGVPSIIPSEFISRTAAIRMLHVSAKTFSGLGLPPAKQVRNPYKGVRWTRLYRRSDIERLVNTPAVLAGQCRKWTHKDYGPTFQQKYGNWHGALSDACRGMAELSSYCSHRSCKERTRMHVHDLKTQLAQLLYEEGVLRNVYEQVYNNEAKKCWGCRGTGTHIQTRAKCYQCDGTGIWKAAETESRVRFEFNVAGMWYELVIPRYDGMFTYQVIRQLQVSRRLMTNASGITPVQRTRAKKLLRWVVAERQAELQAKNAASSVALAA